MAPSDHTAAEPALPGPPPDEHDVLNEFLDERVFDMFLAPHFPEFDGLPETLVKQEPYFYAPVEGTLSFMETDDRNFSASSKDSGDFCSDFGEAKRMEAAPNDSVYLCVKSEPASHVGLQAIPRAESFAPPHSPTESLREHEAMRAEFSKVKFGNREHVAVSTADTSVDPIFLDFSPEVMQNLPFRLHVVELPLCLRVETQMKLKLVFSPLPPHSFLHIPQDLVSKAKMCLSDGVAALPAAIRDNLLYMNTYVMTSDLKQLCHICARCIKREQKRALRLKGAPLEAYDRQNTWADGMTKKAVIFNCKEIVALDAPLGLADARTLDLSARIICYCRHHKESQGFKLLFVVTDCRGAVVAKAVLEPVMIMDRKKSAVRERAPEHPLSPNSIDDSLEQVETDTGRKRKKTSVDFGYGLLPLLSDASVARAPLAAPLPAPGQPLIQKIIPALGPIRGGIEVTLLGFNFRPGLTVKFGLKNALATHCWLDSTIVTYLPPALQPGQVLVSFEGLDGGQLVFTYTDDTDRQLIELALQIVGLKMSGRLEDAKNIAKRIVGSDSPQSEWLASARRALEELERGATEQLLILFLRLAELPACLVIPNWLLANAQGQTLLHLAALRRYDSLAMFLLLHGCKADVGDNQNLPPLLYAALSGHRRLIRVLAPRLRPRGERILHYCDANVLDMFAREPLPTLHSADLLSLLAAPRLRPRAQTQSQSDSDFADSEGDSDTDSLRQEPRGLWQKMKAVFHDEGELPSYDDLFPFGPLLGLKPKSREETLLNARLAEDVALDSLEDMVVTFIRHPRKTVENDKMLLFFWFPVLVGIVGLFLYVRITGYEVELVERVKAAGRNALGGMVVGSERLARAFKT